jgi:MoaA/NifB/PqqE/SkfB family radical SAM enzyme
MDLQHITPISTSFNLDIVQVEVSSKCTLKCPRCPRTELDLDYLNQELSLADFKNIFTPTVLNQIKYLLFCGHTGDPIYAKEFLDIVEYVKQNSSTRIEIVTNGSYKQAEWWTRLGLALDANDGVVFSIDGWDEDSNNEYRVFSDWNSTIRGIQTLKEVGKCYVNWSTIYFKFNQDKIDTIAKIAERWGCDTFQLVKSAKFDGRYLVDGIDPLKPTAELVSKNNNYERNKLVFGRDDPFVIEQTKNVHPYAKCLNGAKELNVTVEGDVYPCGWFNTGYQENNFVKKYKNRISAKTRSLKAILEDPIWDDLTKEFNLEICRIKCQSCK